MLNIFLHYQAFYFYFYTDFFFLLCQGFFFYAVQYTMYTAEKNNTRQSRKKTFSMEEKSLEELKSAQYILKMLGRAEQMISIPETCFEEPRHLSA